MHARNASTVTSPHRRTKSDDYLPKRPPGRSNRLRGELAMIVRVSINEGDEQPQSPGTFVRTLLVALNETQSSASRKSGINRAILGRWMKDEMEPGIKNARKFADALGVPRPVVMLGLGILEPEDIALEPVIAELAEVYSLMTDDAERQKVHDQIDFISSMAKGRITYEPHAKKSRREAG
jgi:transcriptional regulator with XRE-family HTH domain